MNGKRIIPVIGLALCVGACSSKPRAFTPMLGAAAESQESYQVAVAECQQLAATGKLQRKERLASGAAAAAGTAATYAAGSAAVASSGSYVGAMAAASAAIVAMPVVGLVGAWGLAKRKRLQKEKVIKAATADCLQERGYQVAEWVRTKKVKEQPAPAQ